MCINMFIAVAGTEAQTTNKTYKINTWMNEVWCVCVIECWAIMKAYVCVCLRKHTHRIGKEEMDNYWLPFILLTPTWINTYQMSTLLGTALWDEDKVVN
jgi:hypothetical protein